MSVCPTGHIDDGSSNGPGVIDDGGTRLAIGTKTDTSSRIYDTLCQSERMRIEYDRDICIGMFQCVDEWGRFTRDMDAGKAVLDAGEPAGGERFVRQVPEDEEFDAEMAALVCPVDAITLYDDDGEQLVP